MNRAMAKRIVKMCLKHKLLYFVIHSSPYEKFSFAYKSTAPGFECGRSAIGDNFFARLAFGEIFQCIFDQSNYREIDHRVQKK